MIKLLLSIGVIGLTSLPVVAFAEDTTTVQQTQVDSTPTNPVVEVVLLPVRLVTGVIGAPIGAVGGLITGFAKGFAWPSHMHSVQTTQTTTKSY